MGYALLKEKPLLGQKIAHPQLSARERAARRWGIKEKSEVKSNFASGRIVYNYFRYYDPQLGRYITSDPIGLRGGLNTYFYANANPVMYYDPYGLDVTIGFHQIATGVLPTSGDGFGVEGLNQQAFISENGIELSTFEFSGEGSGLDLGAGSEFVFGVGEGEWAGDFSSFTANVGPLSGSIYWSPGEGGWFGFTIGASIGSPIGFAYEETFYDETGSIYFGFDTCR